MGTASKRWMGALRTSATPVSRSTQLGEFVAEYAWQPSSPYVIGYSFVVEPTVLCSTWLPPDVEVAASSQEVVETHGQSVLPGSCPATSRATAATVARRHIDELTGTYDVQVFCVVRVRHDDELAPRTTD